MGGEALAHGVTWPAAGHREPTVALTQNSDGQISLRTAVGREQMTLPLFFMLCVDYINTCVVRV